MTRGMKFDVVHSNVHSNFDAALSVQYADASYQLSQSHLRTALQCRVFDIAWATSGCSSDDMLLCHRSTSRYTLQGEILTTLELKGTTKTMSDEQFYVQITC